jgi:N-terminal acetyltransferase 2
MSLAWARALPLGRIGLSAQASAWRPVFALRGGAQQTGTLAQPLVRRSAATQMQMHTLPARSRYGPARPRFTAGGNAGASPKRGFRFSPWSRTGKSNGGKPVEEPLSVTARLRKLFREYGKAAVVVYFTLSVLDFPFFFMIVRIVGTETIGWFSSSDMLPFSFFLFPFFFFSFED